MDGFKTFEGEFVDLDDMDIYPDEWKNKTVFELWRLGWVKAGKSIFYMKYIWPEMDRGDQWFRVDKLSDELMVLHKILKDDNEQNRLFFMKWLFRFEDEVENQC